MNTHRAPTEAAEQIKLASWLDAQGFLWCHVPNEIYGLLHPASINNLRKQGLKNGVPDVLIYDAPNKICRQPTDSYPGNKSSVGDAKNIAKHGVCSGKEGDKQAIRSGITFGPPQSLGSRAMVGAAIELKRRGKKFKPPSDDQMKWMYMLHQRGWACYVAGGADDAIDWLRGLYTEHAPAWADVEVKDVN